MASRDPIDFNRYKYLSYLDFGETDRFMDAYEMHLHFGVPIPKGVDSNRIVIAALEAAHAEIELMRQQGL